ncbi:MAG: hypothetical protein AB7G06_01900 [Bdellovibrionales bacterium]
MRKFLILFFVVTVAASSAVAQTAPPMILPGLGKSPNREELKVNTQGISYDNAPDPQTLPVLKPFRERQARFFYMGRTAGLDGWFMMLPQNYVQIVYTSLDGNDLVVGFITGRDGRNITEQQMVNLREREADVNKLFTDKIEEAKARLQRDRGFHELMTNLNIDKPGDQMYASFTQAPNIEIGDQDAPLLLMIIDPRCPFCKQAYKKLDKDYIRKDKVLVRILPVGILGDDSMRMAQKLLDNPDDLTLFKEFVEKDFSKDVLAGEPTARGKQNYALVAGLYNRWKLDGTPFFIYRSKGGAIKVLNELPRDWDAMIGDIAPPPKLQ